MAEATTARVLGPNDGKVGRLGSIGVRFMLDGDETGGGFSLVEHPMPPRALAAPLHRHSREDEYSLVLDGHVVLRTRVQGTDAVAVGVGAATDLLDGRGGRALMAVEDFVA